MVHPVEPAFGVIGAALGQPGPLLQLGDLSLGPRQFLPMLLGYVLGETASFGVAYGAATFGNRDNNLTLGAGWAFVDWNWADNPTISLSGMVRASRKTYLLTENYYIGISEGESVVLIALGGRSVQKKLAIDYGLVIPLVSGMETFFALPWLGISVPFGNTQ